MLPRRKYRGKMEKDHRMMSHLRLLQTQRAMIFYYAVQSGQPRTMRFDKGVEVFDAGAMVKVYPDSDSEDDSDSDSEDDFKEKSKMDIWAETNDIEQSFQLLHQILKKVQEEVEILSKKSQRLLIRQSKKTRPNFQVDASSSFNRQTIINSGCRQLQPGGADQCGRH